VQQRQLLFKTSHHHNYGVWIDLLNILVIYILKSDLNVIVYENCWLYRVRDEYVIINCCIVMAWVFVVLFMKCQLQQEVKKATTRIYVSLSLYIHIYMDVVVVISSCRSVIIIIGNTSTDGLPQWAINGLGWATNWLGCAALNTAGQLINMAGQLIDLAGQLFKCDWAAYQYGCANNWLFCVYVILQFSVYYLWWLCAVRWYYFGESFYAIILWL